VQATRRCQNSRVLQALDYKLAAHTTRRPFGQGVKLDLARRFEHVRLTRAKQDQAHVAIGRMSRELDSLTLR